LRVLIVEDELVSRKKLEKMLAFCDGDIQCVEDGKKGVEAFAAALKNGEPYDLIFLDILMPEMNGLAALEEIRRIEKEKNIVKSVQVKIVMLTGLDDAESVMNSHLSGCDAYLLKPVNKSDLVKILQDFQPL